MLLGRTQHLLQAAKVQDDVFLETKAGTTCDSSTVQLLL
jgi:hypothetical protein